MPSFPSPAHHLVEPAQQEATVGQMVRISRPAALAMANKSPVGGARAAARCPACRPGSRHALPALNARDLCDHVAPWPAGRRCRPRCCGFADGSTASQLPEHGGDKLWFAENFRAGLERCCRWRVVRRGGAERRCGGRRLCGLCWWGVPCPWAACKGYILWMRSHGHVWSVGVLRKDELKPKKQTRKKMHRYRP